MILATFLALSLPVQKLNRNGPRTYTFSGRRNGHTYSVRLEQANFKARGRKLVWVNVVGHAPRGTVDYPVIEVRRRPNQDGEYSSIFPGFIWKGRANMFWESDGRSYREIVGQKVEPKVRNCTELSGIRVVIDGKNFDVNRTLYWDLLNPNFDRELIRSNLSKDGRTLTVGMAGSDGGGSYFAQWTFRKNGLHSRVMLDPDTAWPDP